MHRATKSNQQFQRISMPTNITRKGKIYVEYSAVELDTIRHKILEDACAKRGQFRFAASILMSNQAINKTGKRWTKDP